MEIMPANSDLCFIRIQEDELDPGPLPVPFHDSTMGPFTHWKLPWLRLTADDGLVGQAPAALHPLVRGLLLKEHHDLPGWWHRAFWALRNNGHRNPQTSSCISALDMAGCDILAQRCGLSWHRFMQAKRNAVPVYGSGGGTNLTIEQLTAEMRDLVRCGFTTVKMKVAKDFGAKPDEDVERVRAVREAVGNAVGLAVDANQAWDSGQALAFARRIADLNIAWFEEPVHSADRAALHELCSACPIPVAMGESENHWLGFRDLAECGVAHLQPSPHGLPGYTAWSEAVAFAEKSGRQWSSGGYSHLTALYVATRDGGVVEYLRAIIGHLATCFLLKPAIEHGMIQLPETPGLPVRVDWERLNARGAVRTLWDECA